MEEKLEEKTEIEEIFELGICELELTKLEELEEFWVIEFWEKLEEDLADWIEELSFCCGPLGVGNVGGVGPVGSKSAKDETEKLKISKKVKTEKLRNKQAFLKD